jgi:hypothetical protein
MQIPADEPSTREPVRFRALPTTHERVGKNGDKMGKLRGKVRFFYQPVSTLHRSRRW